MAIKVVIAYTADMATELRSEGMAAENIQVDAWAPCI